MAESAGLPRPLRDLAMTLSCLRLSNPPPLRLLDSRLPPERLAQHPADVIQDGPIVVLVEKTSECSHHTRSLRFQLLVLAGQQRRESARVQVPFLFGSAQSAHDERSQQSEQLSGLSGIQPGGLAQTSLHRLLSSAQDVTEDPGTVLAAPASADESSHIVQNATVVILGHGVIQRLRLLGITRVPRDRSEEERKGSLYGKIGRAHV